MNGRRNLRALDEPFHPHSRHGGLGTGRDETDLLDRWDGCRHGLGDLDLADLRHLAQARRDQRDKEAASLLAREVGADLFIILTAIERVYLDFGKPGQREAPVLTVEEAKKHLADGEFPAGSMGPKIRAAIEYIEAGGREVLITKDSHLKAALLNRSGTRIVASA